MLAERRPEMSRGVVAALEHVLDRVFEVPARAAATILREKPRKKERGERRAK